MPVLDTTFLVELDRGSDRARAFLTTLLEEGQPLLVPIQAAIEIASGSDDPAAVMREMRTAFGVVPCGPEIALEAARLARSSRRAGTFPGWSDIQVAATARQQGMTLVTNNRRHFEPLGVEIRGHP